MRKTDKETHPDIGHDDLRNLEGELAAVHAWCDGQAALEVEVFVARPLKLGISIHIRRTSS